MNLKLKTDLELVSELKSLVKVERESTLGVLHYLEEVDSRKLYLEVPLPSLFEWVREILGYSEPAAQRRINAMRLLRVVPELENKIESGELSLSVASSAQSFFKREDKRRREQKAPPLLLQDKKEIALSLVGASSRECERKLAEISPELKPPEKTKALSKDQTLVQFVADRELMEKLEKLKNLLAHQLHSKEQPLQGLIEKLADLALKQLEPKKPKPKKSEASLAEHSNTEHSSPNSFPTSELRSRHIPLEVQRAVRLRDKDRCTYKNPKTGKTCNSQHALEFDHHPVPFALGGEHTLENLSQRCQAHNRYTAEKRFGVFRS